MLRDLTVRMTDASAGQRLDRAILAALPGVSRASLAEAFARGHVSIAGRRADKGDRAVAGEDVRIVAVDEREDAQAVPAEGPLVVLHEDAALLAFDKPGGVDCHPVTSGETGTLVNAMLSRWPDLAGIGGDPRMPALLHRIDAGTSGLVLAARTEAAFQDLRAQFAGHAVEKIYLALVEGRVDAPGGVSGWLAHTPGDRGTMRVVSPQTVPRKERPLRAETFFRPLRRLAGRTLLEVTIRTGVTHQIRCQLASIGHPVCGDTTYGASGLFPEAVRRHFLHASKATFRHPLDNRTMTLEAPVAADMRAQLGETGTAGCSAATAPGSKGR